MSQKLYIFDAYIMYHIACVSWEDYPVADPAGGPGPLAPIFEAPDYILRPKLHLFYTQITEKFSKKFASLRSAYYFNS